MSALLQFQNGNFPNAPNSSPEEPAATMCFDPTHTADEEDILMP
jgi:hypothetical protein